MRALNLMAGKLGFEQMAKKYLKQLVGKQGPRDENELFKRDAVKILRFTARETKRNHLVYRLQLLTLFSGLAS